MHSYQYDEDNRLWLAKGTSPNSSLSYDQYMSYSPAGAIGKKDIQMNSIKNSSTQSYTYWGRYEYTSQSNPYAAQYIYDENNNYTLDETLCWDRAGNLSLSASNATGKEAMYWTEDNRMQLYIRMGGDNSVAYYRYDDSGKRELKLLGRRSDVYNMGYQHNFINFDDMVLYAGDLATFDRQGFKKHYFVEGERFLTNCGSEGHPSVDPLEPLKGIEPDNPFGMNERFEENVINYFAYHKPSDCIDINIDKSNIAEELQYIHEWWLKCLVDYQKPEFYYLHTDRLGSGSAVTDGSGEAVHVLGYMPYGETLLDLSQGFETPYRFTGYEKDRESGLNYAGARYYDSWLSIFNSTDPMWYKYPHLSPYTYCSNNPIMRIDPDGMADDWVESKDGKIYWDDNATSQETTKNGEKYLGKNVLVATHNRGEQLNEPINSARFELYLEGNKDGVSSVIYGNTVPADVNEYGTLAEGLYSAEFGQRAKYVKRGDYDPGLLINNGKAVPTAPGSPKSTITEIFFHKGNNNRESLSDNRGNPYSAGCQTGGNYKGSHKAYYQFAKNLVGFKGSYYLRGQLQQKQSPNSVILKIDIVPLPNDNTRIVHSIK